MSRRSDLDDVEALIWETWKVPLTDTYRGVLIALDAKVLHATVLYLSKTQPSWPILPDFRAVYRLIESRDAVADPLARCPRCDNEGVHDPTASGTSVLCDCPVGTRRARSGGAPGERSGRPSRIPEGEQLQAMAELAGIRRRYPWLRRDGRT